ncbi:MAG TPA: DUF4339 domain-containing protein, partial [Pirellulaceae bacterium]|nr:DUF4339 domain-containing protein [Pirellulaceae bacterium]
MQATWYCRIGDRQYGPISVAQLQRLAARGDLTPTCLVRRSDETTWYEASRVGGLWARATPLPPGGGPGAGFAGPGVGGGAAAPASPPVAVDSPSSGTMSSLPMEIVPIEPTNVLRGAAGGTSESSAVIPLAGGDGGAPETEPRSG